MEFFCIVQFWSPNTLGRIIYIFLVPEIIMCFRNKRSRIIAINHCGIDKARNEIWLAGAPSHIMTNARDFLAQKELFTYLL